jgi:hydrogenase nickel incorporation protein HypB
MCEACGCSASDVAGKDAETVAVLHRLLDANDQTAAHNRAHFNSHRVVAVNLMSAPGAGKTALLEATIDALKDEFHMAVIEGDLETDNDARRIRARGVPAIQITTGNACHLDARMVHDALHELPLFDLDIVFIENVGNLVCPASFDLGQHRNVVLLSATEGDDKPAKYPVMFRTADLVLLSKMDLAEVLGDFDAARAEQAVRELANAAPVLSISARKAVKLEIWTGWLRGEVTTIRAAQAVTPLAQGNHYHRHEHHHSPAVA